MPLISVIVPVYKVEPYLHQCVDSILNQTFKDYELILVDDGSPDNCPLICDEYAQKDNRVIVIHKENGGLSSARNAGLDYVFANSESEYVSFIDSDDYVDKQLYERCLPLFGQGVDAVKYSYEKIKDELVYSKFIIPERKFVFENDKEKKEFINNCLLLYKIGWESWSILFKKEIIKNNKLYFEDNGIIYAEDIHYFVRYVLYSSSLISVNAYLYKYRIRNDSITSNLIDYKINEMNNLAYCLYNSEIKNRPMFVKDYYKMWFLIINNRLALVTSILRKNEIKNMIRIYKGISKAEFFKENMKKYKVFYKKEHQGGILLIDQKYIIYSFLISGNYLKIYIQRFICYCYFVLKRLFK